MFIAICDDEPHFVSQFSATIQRILSAEDICITYHHGDDLLSACEAQGYPFDLVFLDIVMPGIDGHDVARELGKISPGTFIVFLTNYRQYAYESYSLRPYHYLTKPPRIEDLLHIVEDIREIIRRQESSCLTIQTKSAYTYVPLHDIVYIESMGKRLIAHTALAEYSYYGTLRDLADDLKSKGFYLIHHAYLVPLSRVQHVSRSEKQVLLSGVSQKLPVSSRRMRPFIKALAETRKLC